MVAAVFLSACGGDDGPTGTSTVENTPARTATSLPGSTTPSPVPLPTGVSGVALVGPACPVIRQDTPCPDKPWEGTVVARTPSGAEVARADTDSEGRFRLLLPPGDYVVVTLTTGIFPAPASVEVTVVADQLTEIALLLDSGIR